MKKLLAIIAVIIVAIVGIYTGYNKITDDTYKKVKSLENTISVNWDMVKSGINTCDRDITKLQGIYPKEETLDNYTAKLNEIIELQEQIVVSSSNNQMNKTFELIHKLKDSVENTTKELPNFFDNRTSLAYHIDNLLEYEPLLNNYNTQFEQTKKSIFTQKVPKTLLDTKFE